MIKRVSLNSAEYVAYRLAKELMDYSEPIPEFSNRFPNKLESCLNQPFLKFNEKALYRTLIERAALLFYLVIKNHPFEN